MMYIILQNHVDRLCTKAIKSGRDKDIASYRRAQRFFEAYKASHGC